MTKVFNFKTMQFEQASKDEGNDLLSLIDAMNSDCVAQLRVQTDAPNWVCRNCEAENPPINTNCHHCNGTARW